MRWATTTAACLVALVFLGMAWELFLAPIRPGGTWWVLKVVPLMAALPGVLRERRYTVQWSTLIIWLYAAEGAARAYTDPGLGAALALAQFLLAVAYFFAAVAWLKVMPRAT